MQQVVTVSFYYEDNVFRVHPSVAQLVNRFSSSATDCARLVEGLRAFQFQIMAFFPSNATSHLRRTRRIRFLCSQAEEFLFKFRTDVRLILRDITVLERCTLLNEIQYAVDSLEAEHRVPGL